MCIRRRDAQGLQELALAERLGERLHLREGDGPVAHRVRVAAPAAQQWADTGSNGRSMESYHACTHAHPHARDRHTDAFGAVIVP